MDVHPIFVHFPIALLVIYSMMEIFTWKKLRKNVSWFYVKFSFLIIGSILAIITLQTGEGAEQAIDASLRHLVEVHSSWAFATTILFVVLCGLYVLELISNERLIEKRIIPSKIRKPLAKFSGYLFRPVYLKVLALIGFTLMIITGSLGGAIVYGPEVDPVVRFIYYLLIRS